MLARVAAVVALLVAALGGAGCLGSMRGSVEPGDSGVPSNTGWVDAHGGFTFADTLVIGSALTLDGDGTPAGGFGVNVFYRTPRLDLGGLVESIGGFRFESLNSTFTTGSHLRVAASVRWRYVDETWGALFLRLAPGASIFRHSDKVRLSVAQLVGRGQAGDDFEGVSDVTAGFSLGFDFGALIYASDRVAISAHLDVVTAATSLDAFGTDLEYATIRGLFSIGIEWRM